MSKDSTPIRCCFPASESLYKEELCEFLYSVDKDFTPCLSAKVELDAWSEKVLNQASYVACYEEHRLAGLLVFYCNDFQTSRSYISLLGVGRQYRGKGYARKMLLQTIECVKEKNFSVIGVHSNNPTAINLYRSVGFNIVGEAVEGRYYLELSL